MRFLLVFLIFSISNLTAQTIRINEVVSSNSEHEDEDGDTPDWLELYNYGTQEVSINNWTLTDDVDDLTQWTFPNITLAPNQYLLIWASSKDRLPTTGNLHTNFKISSSSETLTLTNASGTVVDQVYQENLVANTSIGISINSGALVYYSETTPGAENSNNEFLGSIQSEVIFSNEGGLVNGPVSLVLSGNTTEEEIRYTIGGDAPTVTSTLYSSPIQINANTSVRAQIFSENHMPSSVYTKSYILNAHHEIDVMLLTVAPDDFFDEDTGIYVVGPSGDPSDRGANFRQDWERPIHFAFYENGENTFVEFNAGVKIFGGSSRKNAQRSLALYARSEYGDSEFEHSFFDELSYNTFESVVLRNSGQDWLKSSMKDITLTSLMRGSGLDFQEHTPVATYINGEYWGKYNLREKVSEHMLASKHNIDADDITLLENNESREVGSRVEYDELLDYIRTTDLSNDSNFEHVAQEIDLKEYALYQATQIFIDNRDWPSNNNRYWKHSEGKWRWIMYDTDAGFNEVDWSQNTLENVLAENGTLAPWSTLLFRNLVTNIGFRNMFINRYADELNTRFLPSKVNAHIDTIYSTIEPEIDASYLRWDTDPSRATWFMNSMKTFANNRPAVVKTHIKSQFNLPAYHPLTITNIEISEGFVEVNSNLNIQETTWSGDYFETVPIQLTAKPNAGFEFSHWSGDISSTEETISVSMVGNLEVTPNFTATDIKDPIVINEINYKSNDSFNPDDWVALYNPNETSIDLSNWQLKDDNDDNSFTIPTGTTIDAGGYLVLVKSASDFSAVFPEITNFIGEFDFGFGTSDAVRLFDANSSLQDEVVYQSEAPWSNCADESGFTLELISPDLDNALPESWNCINTNGSPNAINNPSTPILSTIIINEINYKSNDSFNADDWVELYNTSTSAVDLSNWQLKDDNDDNSFTIPTGTTIDAGGYLVLVKSASDFSAVFPDITNIIGEFDFGFGTSDAVRLFDANSSLHDEVVYQSEAQWSNCADETGNTLELITPDLDNALPDSWTCINTNGSPNAINGSSSLLATIVINEINYKSSDSFNPGDWIEFYNPNTTVIDLSNWQLKDDNDDSNSFTIPAGTTIDAGGYLVLVKSASDFSAVFPDITNIIGEFDFGFESADAIELYDAKGSLQDEVVYQSEAPWSNCADEKGNTLELITPDLDNALPDSWTCINTNGSPNAINSSKIVFLTITNPAPTEGYVEVNSNINIKEDSWSDSFSETMPIQLKAIPEAGYEFSHWSGDISSTDETISLTLEGDFEVTPNFSPIISKDPIVINEINYKSSDSFDANDWVELYNPNTTSIDLSNWQLKDGNDSNSFTIPLGVTIDAGGYIVIVRNTSDFSAVFPEITNYIGHISFDFGTSDAVRLFDSSSSLQDEVSYLSEAPWSNCANETGNTLQLITPDLDNSLPKSWNCVDTNGSPNAINSSAIYTDDGQVSIRIYPNPAQDILSINGILNQFKVQVFNLKGQVVFDLQDTHRLDVTHLTQGLYIIQISEGQKNTVFKFLKR